MSWKLSAKGNWVKGWGKLLCSKLLQPIPDWHSGTDDPAKTKEEVCHDHEKDWWHSVYPYWTDTIVVLYLSEERSKCALEYTTTCNANAFPL
jgi:hypothetical protein